MTQACAEIARSAGEPLAGTAAHATVVLAVEECGGWAMKAIASPGLAPIAPILRRWLEAIPGARLQLIRRPGDRRPCEGGGLPRMVYLARVGATGRMHAYTLRDEDFDAFDIQKAVARLDDDATESAQDGLLLVCTHGKRDQCCALYGQRFFRAAQATWQDRVWMTSHVGGHRFAATTIQLPSGLCHGHLDESEAEDLPAAKLRGRLCYPAVVQCAEVLLMQSDGPFSGGEMSPRFLHCEDLADGLAEVRFTDGKKDYLVSLQQVTQGPRVLSCGEGEKSIPRWLATGWRTAPVQAERGGEESQGPMETRR